MLQEHAYQSIILGNGVLYTLKFPGDTVNVLGIYVRTNQTGTHRTTDKYYFANQQSIRVDLLDYQVNVSELNIAGLSN